jgi:hypothetical protein
MLWQRRSLAWEFDLEWVGEAPADASAAVAAASAAAGEAMALIAAAVGA